MGGSPARSDTMKYSIKQNHPIFKSASTVELSGIVYTLPVATYSQLKYLVEQHLSGNSKLETLKRELETL
jgi:hypothetical protein